MRGYALCPLQVLPLHPIPRLYSVLHSWLWDQERHPL